MEIIQRTIKALSLKRIEEGSIGFVTTTEDKWYNVSGEKEVLEELVKNVVAKGNEIEFEYNNGVVGSLKLIQKAPEENADMIKIGGKDFMKYQGLLKKAHEKGENFSMVVLESTRNDDMTIAYCRVRLTAGDRTFDGEGSSTPGNATAIGSSHPVEIANTRAKGRALRDYLNIGEVMAEELAK